MNHSGLLVSFAEYSCQGGWREPLEEGTALTAEDLMSHSKRRSYAEEIGGRLHVSGGADLQAAAQRPPGYVQYLILSPTGSDRRLCAAVRIANPLDLTSVHIAASSNDCPDQMSFYTTSLPPPTQHSTNTWNFQLNRLSKPKTLGIRLLTHQYFTDHKSF